MKLTSRNIVITGASSGIGRQLAIDLAPENTVILVSRNKEKLTQVLDEVRKLGKASSMHICDVSDRSAVERTAKAILKEHGHVDVLINNAGFGINKSFLDTSEEDFESQLSTNVMGIVHFTQALLPQMIERRQGHIVNVGSVVSKMSVPKMSGYCASKFAVMGLTESLFYELRGSGVGITMVCPGRTETGFFDHPSFKDRKRNSDRLVKMVSPKVISQAAIRAVEKDRFEVVVPGCLNVPIWFRSNFPGLFRSLMGKLA